jgi:CHAT domain-containing protein/tetratricopeptide (TPR) repeat protein
MRYLIVLPTIVLLAAAPCAAVELSPEQASAFEKIRALRQELGRLDLGKSAAKERRAEIQKSLPDLYEAAAPDSSEFQERAIAAFRAALNFYTRSKYPNVWAGLQNDLGVRLGDRIKGNKASNQDQAIAAYRSALSIYSETNNPTDWARAQHNLGVTLYEREGGVRAANIEQSIQALTLALRVRTKEAMPKSFASTSRSLAGSLSARKAGDERENVHAAIEAYSDALSVTEQDGDNRAQILWKVARLHVRASDMGNDEAREKGIRTYKAAIEDPAIDANDRAEMADELGDLFLARKGGAQAADVEGAISSYEAALRSIDKRQNPEEWVTVQIDLGNALLDRQRGSRADNVERAIGANREARGLIDRSKAPQDWANIQNNLGSAFDDRILGDRRDNLDKSIRYFSLALTHTSRKRKPQDWADFQDNLGVAYSHRSRNNPPDSDRAIEHFSKALLVKKVDSSARANTLNNLGEAYLHRWKGSKTENYETAIDCFREAALGARKAGNENDWARATDNLGTALMDRIKGDAAQNLEDAIVAYQEALTVRTLEAAPRDWGATQNNLALALLDRIRGDRNENIEAAIAGLQLALKFYPKSADVDTWAAISDNLGNALRVRRFGDRDANIRAAIAAYDEALTIRRRNNAPFEWAGTTLNRAVAYHGMRTGDTASNLFEARKGYEGVLQVQTKTTSPYSWASAMNNLGTVLADWPDDPEANIKLAIDYYKGALTIRTKSSYPADWASTTHNLAVALAKFPGGDRTQNVETAIGLFREVLQQRTRLGDPREFISTQKQLARAYARRQQGDGRENLRLQKEALRAAMDAVDDLIGDGLGQERTIEAMEAGGEVFRSAALVAGQLGDVQGAIEIAERGRARMLQLALHLDEAAARLPPEARKRLAALRDELDRIRVDLADRVPLEAGNSQLDAFLARRNDRESRVATLRKEISEVVKQPVIAFGDLPKPSVDEAFVIPVVAREGALLIVETEQQTKAVELSDFGDERMRYWFYGPSGRWAEGGWSRGYQSILAVTLSDLPAEWQTAMAGFQTDAWNVLVVPLLKSLEDAGLKPGARLVLMTQDYLARMPLWLARDPASGKTLGEIYQIRLTPNLATLKARPRSAGHDVAAYFNERAKPALSLSGLAKGLLQEIHPEAEVLSASDADNRTVLIDHLADHDAWMIWTHGLFDRGDVRRSYLQLSGDLSDGSKERFTVDDLLSSRFDDRTSPRLVVLMACESGLADISHEDELIGIPSALIKAGVRAVISPMWPVDQRASLLLMLKFEELYFDERMQASSALSKAAQWLRTATAGDLTDYLDTLPATRRPMTDVDFARSYEELYSDLESYEAATLLYSDPFFWGAFYLTGGEADPIGTSEGRR